MGSNCAERRGKELFLSCDPTKCLNHLLLLTFFIKAGSLNRGTNTALLSCCPAQNLHWQSFMRDSQETFKTFVARAYLPEKKKLFSCSEKCVQTIRSPQKCVTPFTMPSALSGEQQFVRIFVYQLLVVLWWPSAIIHLGASAVLGDKCS